MAINLGQQPLTPPVPGATYSQPAVPGGPGGGWNPMPASGGFGGGFASNNASGEAELARRRAGLDARFAQIYGMQQPMADGSDPAFSAAARQGLLAQASDAGYGQARSAERMLRQGFRSGTGGQVSGGELQAITDARRGAAQDTWARRAGLETTFELENRSARERGIQSMLATLGLELPYQSRFEVIGSDPLSEAFARMLGGGGGTGFGGQVSENGRSQAPAYDFSKGHPEYGFTYAPQVGGYQQPAAQSPQGPFSYGGVYRAGTGQGGY